jgi:hypothetical protein
MPPKVPPKVTSTPNKVTSTPNKVKANTPNPTSTSSSTQPKVVKKDVPKTKPLIHDFIAAHQKIPLVTDTNGNVLLDEEGNEQMPEFFDVLSFYEKQFMKEICVSKQFMDQKSAKRYVINPNTGTPYDAYIRSFQFKYNWNNAVKYGERMISLTRFLTNEQFCNRVIAYYKSIGYNCEIYQSGFDKSKQKYSKVCVKVYL